jgi:hypothetical protein
MRMSLIIKNKEKEEARGFGNAADAYAAIAVTPMNQTNFDEDIATGIVFGKFLLTTPPILPSPSPNGLRNTPV